MPKNTVNPTLSIILPTRNNADHLPELLEAIEQQMTPDYELIVVDGASQDQTLELLRAHQQNQPNLRLIQLTEDQGSGAARNAGLEASRGNLIAFQDDTCLPVSQRFTRQLELLQNHPEIDLVFSSLAWISENQNNQWVRPALIERGEFPPHSEYIFKLLYLEGNQIPTSTLMFRRKILDQYGGYPLAPLGCEEWLRMMQWAALGVRMLALPDPLVSRPLKSSKFNTHQHTRRMEQSERQTLRQMHTWLAEQDIRGYENLKPRAWSHQMLRESHRQKGLARLLLRIRALLCCPSSHTAWKTIAGRTHKEKR